MIIMLCLEYPEPTHRSTDLQCSPIMQEFPDRGTVSDLDIGVYERFSSFANFKSLGLCRIRDGPRNLTRCLCCVLSGALQIIGCTACQNRLYRTFFSWSCTALLSPPLAAGPQVTMDPSPRMAAKALEEAWIC